MLLAFDKARVLTKNDNFCNLWRALQAVLGSGGDIADQVIVEFATEKILCNSKKARNIYEIKQIVVIEKVTEALAIFGLWLYLEISSLSQQASELVSNYIRILCHVDETRESLVTACPISSIRNYIVVNTGNQSEFVSRILCLLAIDKAIQSKPKVWNIYLQTITIQKFFDALVGQDSWKKLSSIFTIQANSITLRDSKIRFNYFAYVEFTPTRLDLIKFFFHGTAVFCKQNQKEDIIIPVAMV
ncbi:hypothetical protein G9A89_009906 [Geosiphon pyriformis]|nr:hypothetical protein G9A89_009906 [Geosiphon pyriformis]